VDPIRVVLADLPRLLRDILRESLVCEPDVALVGEAPILVQLMPLVKQEGVDVVVLGLSGPDLPASYYTLFEADARVRILAIADQGRNASLYELRPHRKVLGQGSPRELMQMIREEVRSTGPTVGSRPQSES
jgi:DNA-binding NarL/FixJ family response regulator